MSLIHDALREQDGPALPVRPAPRASWWARQPAAVRGPLLFAAAGVAGFLLAGTLLLAFGRRGEAGPPVPVAAVDAADAVLPVTANIAAAPVIATAAAAPPPPASAPATARAEAVAPQAADHPAAPAIAAQVQPALPDAGADAAPVPVHAAPAPAPATAVATRDGAAPAIRIKVERRAAAAPVDAGMDNRAVEQAVAEVERAMAGGDLATARQALAQLDSLLPPESLTLLRMQAWIAHAGNDTAQAETLYRRIAERVPEDVNAGVNIALLDARRGDADAARQRLARLSGRYPRSPQVARALAELDGAAP